MNEEKPVTQNNRDLYARATIAGHEMQNRIVMAPMTRNRAIDNLPNALMAEYYAQRASAGLIVTEGTSPSPDGLGYPRIPGLFFEAQVAGWKGVTEAVHAGGARIFAQLMHTGRIGHPDNLPPDAELLAPSAIAAAGEIYTDRAGMQPHPAPREMNLDDIARTRDAYVKAAENAIAAGFDGVELHGANGYLLEQFIRPISNQRGDEYGGPIENRARFVFEVAQATIEAIGASRVGIRLSPFGVFNDMPPYAEMDADYTYLAAQLGKQGLAYLHIVDHSPMGAPEVPEHLKQAMRAAFGGPVIRVGGYDAKRAQADLDAGRADLIAVGRDFLANPDLPTRWQQGLPLNAPDFDTFYTPGEKGYTDYPTHGH
jgi:N-ethylmaleimide reductase